MAVSNPEVLSPPPGAARRGHHPARPSPSGSFAAAVLLAVFLWIETRTSQPITPLHLFADRNRAGSYAIMLALAVALVVVRARAPEAEAEQVVAGS
jgi:hypothetical protein